MKTAAELLITQAEFDAFVKTRDLLAAKAIKRDATSNPEDVLDTFDMNSSCAARALGSRDHNICGTVMCIGGWVKLFMLGIEKNDRGIFAIDRKAEFQIADYVMNVDEDANKGKHDLFFPPVNDWSRITPHRAAKAITNFLETGKPSWSKALA